MITATDIFKMSFEELKELLTKEGYKDKNGYVITVEFPDGHRRLGSAMSYRLAADYIYEAIHDSHYRGCSFLVESQYENSADIAFWIFE